MQHTHSYTGGGCLWWDRGQGWRFRKMADSAQAEVEGSTGIRSWWVESVSDNFPSQHLCWKAPAQFVCCSHRFSVLFFLPLKFLCYFFSPPYHSLSLTLPSCQMYCKLNVSKSRISHAAGIMSMIPWKMFWVPQKSVKLYQDANCRDFVA